MKIQYKSSLLMLTLIGLMTFSSFSTRESKHATHAVITRTVERNQDKELIKTEIVLNGKTTREELIEACASLSKENVALTFDLLSIRKRVLGFFGKSRIAYAKGKIQLPDGSTEEFKAGGLFNFKYIRITYTQVANTNEYTINLVEVVD